MRGFVVAILIVIPSLAFAQSLGEAQLRAAISVLNEEKGAAENSAMRAIMQGEAAAAALQDADATQDAMQDAEEN